MLVVRGLLRRPVRPSPRLVHPPCSGHPLSWERGVLGDVAVLAMLSQPAQGSSPLATALTEVLAGLFDPRSVVAACGVVPACYCLAQFGNRALLCAEDRDWVEGLATARRGMGRAAARSVSLCASVVYLWGRRSTQVAPEEEGSAMALPADTFVKIDAAMRRFGADGGADRALRYLLRELRALPTDAPALEPLSDQDRARLDAAGFTAEPREARHRATLDPILRGASHRAALVGTALPPEEVARGLGRDVTRIYHMLGERQLYGVRDGRRWRLPRFQFAGDGDTLAIVPGVTTLFPALPRDLGVAAIGNWFTVVAQPRLVSEGGRALAPRDWLLAGGDPQRVTLPELLFM